eukprot:CAMPEP_0201716648 /NCGR_PEP_ID=MMETSP0593-20130828/2577_1 /ASSEMBLY_ACC=CAM_ASM_000672 /TAXON_ID=267983 /ORGANISM="Skeletonema japonicum, Strain CCMP2506" /LENGTH=199 /DNA_ID=CAMNT_0048206497 /DNA_START=138 /DNA_END=737 /DNA_ORIENTATION=-
MMCLEKNINAYALFQVLEKQRILELRELYCQRLDAPSVNGSSSVQMQTSQEHSAVPLPKLPPRYQHLKVTTDWLILQLRKQRPTSQTFDEFKALDNVTKTFLDDTARVLLDEHEENAIINHFRSKLCFMPRSKRSSIEITPPSSPVMLPRVTLTEEEPPVMSLSKPPSASIHEVDLTDEQIITIYESSEPSRDAVVLNI